MRKRLQDYLKYAKSINISDMSDEMRHQLKADMLVQISFFQHERLIHLIVTVCFALLAMLSLMLLMYAPSTVSLAFTALFVILLIPYILHYYFLENGVQELYKIYDKL